MRHRANASPPTAQGVHHGQENAEENAAPTSPQPQLSGTVKDSAQQIWLAGLGAFSKAQEEGGKVPSRRWSRKA
jgi:hypothetical protein